MNVTPTVVASLAGPHIPRFAPQIDIRPDRFGELPALLVNPIDNRGRKIEGLWLIEGSQHSVKGPVYRWIEPRG
ncbi:hypothetical protein HNR05_001375 [Leifsonia psychrotolerans]|uniref:Uncharacterized protein n=1 Tax=Glaciibacter psychrotolerans TaxID=670054 RepID=A0A7Z0EDD6_9MICO|nr:hypothetical protein [Leifsonia psychrotolerans]